jgi:hypothetical protein
MQKPAAMASVAAISEVPPSDDAAAEFEKGA